MLNVKSIDLNNNKIIYKPILNNSQIKIRDVVRTGSVQKTINRGLIRVDSIMNFPAPPLNNFLFVKQSQLCGIEFLV